MKYTKFLVLSLFTMALGGAILFGCEQSNDKKGCNGKQSQSHQRCGAKYRNGCGPENPCQPYHPRRNP